MGGFSLLLLGLVLFVARRAALAQSERDPYAGCVSPVIDVTKVTIGDAPLKERNGDSVEIRRNERGVPGAVVPQGGAGPEGPPGWCRVWTPVTRPMDL